MDEDVVHVDLEVRVTCPNRECGHVWKAAVCFPYSQGVVENHERVVPLGPATLQCPECDKWFLIRVVWAPYVEIGKVYW